MITAHLDRLCQRPWRTGIMLVVLGSLAGPSGAGVALVGWLTILALRGGRAVDRDRVVPRPASSVEAVKAIPRRRRASGHVVVIVPRSVPDLHVARGPERAAMAAVAPIPVFGTGPAMDEASTITSDPEVTRRALPAAVRFLRYDAAPGRPLRVRGLGAAAGDPGPAACLAAMIIAEPVSALRLHALEALWHIDRDRAEALGAAHPDAALRLFIAHHRSPPDRQMIIEIAGDPTAPPGARCEAALRWRVLGGPEEVIADLLAELLSEPPAIRALAEVGGPRHLPALNAVRVGPRRALVEQTMARIHARYSLTGGRLSVPDDLLGALSPRGASL